MYTFTKLHDRRIPKSVSVPWNSSYKRRERASTRQCCPPEAVTFADHLLPHTVTTPARPASRTRPCHGTIVTSSIPLRCRFTGLESSQQRNSDWPLSSALFTRSIFSLSSDSVISSSLKISSTFLAPKHTVQTFDSRHILFGCYVRTVLELRSSLQCTVALSVKRLLPL